MNARISIAIAICAVLAGSMTASAPLSAQGVVNVDRYGNVSADGNVLVGGVILNINDINGEPGLYAPYGGYNAFIFPPLYPSQNVPVEPIVERASPKVINPARNYVTYLVNRDDVQAHILLSSAQRQALNSMQNGARTALFDKLTQNTNSLSQLVQEQSNDSNANLDSQMKELVLERDSIEAKNDLYLMSKLKSILTAKQIARLNELDLIWRGPVAITDQSVAYRVGVSPERKQKIDALYSAYKRKVARSLGVDQNAASARQGTPVSRSAQTTASRTPQDWNIWADRAEREIESYRKRTGNSVYQLLSADQKARWKAFTGKQFTFRVY